MNKIKTMGFTLVEILTTIVIIGIVASIGFFTVSKVIDKSKVEALNKTAITARKSVDLYIANPSFRMGADTKTIELTPDCSGVDCHSDVLELDKDPWGKNYVSVYAYIQKNSAREKSITLRFDLANGDVWILLENDFELSKATIIESIGDIPTTAGIGKTLSAGALTPTGATVAYQWQWASSLVGTYTDIPSATNSTYTLTDTYVDKYIRVKVTGKNLFVGTVNSNSVRVISNIGEVLLVAGGGGGASGGGGGGGVVYANNIAFVEGDFTVVVGAGGIGGSTYNPPTLSSSKGGNSTFLGLTAVGGGAGGAVNNSGITTGGSGGGAGYSAALLNGVAGTAGQGYAGGNNYARPSQPYVAGGGGGASATGGNATSTVSGAGGNGYTSSITGSSLAYGGGGGGGNGNTSTAGAGGTGGGGAGSNSTNGSNGTTNRGGGGGGGRSWGTNTIYGGAGGSGVVIIKYQTGAFTATGGTITTNGIYTIHTFTTGGHFIVTY